MESANLTAYSLDAPFSHAKKYFCLMKMSLLFYKKLYNKYIKNVRFVWKGGCFKWFTY